MGWVSFLEDIQDRLANANTSLAELALGGHRAAIDGKSTYEAVSIRLSILVQLQDDIVRSLALVKKWQQLMEADTPAALGSLGVQLIRENETLKERLFILERRSEQERDHLVSQNRTLKREALEKQPNRELLQRMKQLSAEHEAQILVLNQTIAAQQERIVFLEAMAKGSKQGLPKRVTSAR